MTVRHPALEPFETGMLDVGDGNQIYWEQCGNPSGKPALYLHGGPGGGCGRGVRRYFDPKAYRAVLFDQRGCGRSRPLASDADTDLRTNTTQHLARDIERLRESFGFERWTILGVSWGTTLGLAYAEAHPKRVEALVLALVTTTTRRDVEWMTRDLGRIFPEAWAHFMDAIPPALRHLSPVDAYATMLFDPDPDVRARAATAWCDWDCAQMSLVPSQPSPLFDDATFRLGYARLVTHYWRHAAFLDDDQLLRDAHVLEGIPGVLIHGRYDVSCTLDVPWKLSKRWNTSTLEVIEAGHGNDDTFPIAVTAALDRFA